jgi:hypothetical protein
VERNYQIMGLGIGRLARVLARFIRAKTVVAGKTTSLTRAEKSSPEETLPGAFQAEVLLPIQYYETLRRRHLLEREKLLMFAVLEDAVEGYMKYLKSPTGKGQRRFHEAEDWINRQDKLWLFSFDNTCEALNIEPAYMRRGLHRWKQAQLEPTEQAVTP